MMSTGDQCPNALSTEEKLAIIDDELRMLHHFFISKSFSPLEIERGAQPFLLAVQNHKRKEYLITFAETVVTILLLIILVRYDPVYQLVLTYTRLASVNLLLPIWDWRPLYSGLCFLPNPYFQTKELTLADCEICEAVESIPRLANLTPDQVMDEYILRDAPFIVTDATQDWPAMKLFDIPFLAELYTTHTVMRDYLGCHFFSNIRKTNHKLLIKLAAAGEVHNWYGFWENCLTPASKVLRQYYSRPYFIPPGVEMYNTNWVFVSQNYKGKSFKPLPIEAPFIWFAQLRGSTRLRVVPKDECGNKCRDHEATVNSGDIFVAMDALWAVDFSPSGQEDNVAIGAGGHFD